MATICDRCGKETYVAYLKLNLSRICDECEDQERHTNGMHYDWTLIKENNRKRYQLRYGSIQFNKVVFLDSYRQLAAIRKLKDNPSSLTDVKLPTNLKP